MLLQIFRREEIIIKKKRKNKIKSKEQFVKRTIKDSVFTNLFSDKKYLLQLYNALHPEDVKVTEEDILNVTIKNILTDKQDNNLGFIISNKLLILAEAQSTWTVNITIRALMYLAQTYYKYFREQNINIYSSTRAKIPKPELYVIFTGKRVYKPEYISLSKEFFNGQNCGIEVKVKVIYDGYYSEETGERDIINQYVVFTKVCNEQIALYGRTKKAIAETIQICKDMNVLKEYLESRESEVFDIMLDLLDDEEIMEIYINSTVNEAVNKAVNETTIRTTIEMCQDFGLSIEETIQKLVNKCKLSEENAKVKVQECWK